MKALFYIPCLYTYQTRLESPLKALSLCIIYVIPVCWMAFIVVGECSLTLLLLNLISILAVYNIYELGYIQNDTYTIGLELKPTMRLSSSQITHYNENRPYILLTRVILECLLIFAILSIYPNANILYFIIALLAILGTYQLYNRNRGHINMSLYFILVSLRYCTPLLLFYQLLNWNIIVLMLMVFPIVKTISYKAGSADNVKTNIWFRRYVLKNDKNNLTSFRAWAYLFFLVIAVFLYYIDFFNLWHLLLIGYMTLYRGAIYIAIKLGFTPKYYLK